MLEQMRKQGASIFVYLIFCLLIAIFVINFRPGQSRQDDNGCRGTSNVVISVDGNEATQTAFKMAYSSPYNWGTSKSKVHIALETLIRRELLANEGEKRGLLVNEDLVNEEIKKGFFFSATPPPPGQTEEIEAIYRPIRKMIQGVFDENGYWNLKAFTAWVASLNVSRNAYIEEQRRSILASMMGDILLESIQVSKEEALSEFLYEGNTATYDVVAFKPEMYRNSFRITDADIQRFLKDHADEVQARYKADERTYKGTKPALKLRQIFIAKAEPPKAEAPTPTPTPTPSNGAGSGSGSAAAAAGSGAGSAVTAKADDKKADDKKADDKKADKKADDKKADKKVATKPVGMPIEEAKAKLEAVKKDGKDKFAVAAATLNTDDSAKAVAGDIGWHTIDNAALGDKAVNDAVKTLKPGEMTPVIATDKGAYLILAEDKREGDLSFDQVKTELAWEMAKDVWSKEAAKRAALNALNGAKGAQLDELYQKDAPAGGGMDLEQLLNDPNIPEDQKAKLRELMKGAHGALETAPEKDIPAGWFETQEKTGSAAAPAPATPPATPTPATPAPKTGSAATQAAGSAAAPATGSATSAPAPATPPASPAAPIVASKDTLPLMADVPPPHVTRFNSKSRAKQMNGLGASKEAIAAVFDELQPGQLASRVYEGEGGAYIVVQLVQRNQPNVADFDKDADRRVAELRNARANAFLDEWLRDKCETLAKANKIKPNPELLIERDDQGKVLPVSYHPCMSFH